MSDTKGYKYTTMKNTTFLPILLLLLSFACKKNGIDPTDPSDTFEENKLELKINGTAITFDFVGSVRIVENGDTAIVVTAYLDDMATQSLSLTLPIHVGAYSFLSPDTENNGIPGAVYMQSNTQTNVSESGVLYISAHNKVTRRIQGTFNFVTMPMHEGGEPLNFTNGSFDLEYI
jgi:hypothetical protein